MESLIKLHELKPGERGAVTELNIDGSMRRRFLDIGLICDTVIECVGRSPAGDPSAYRIRGAVIAIRAQDANHIIIRR